MTNAQIVFDNSVQLMRDGAIAGTGTFVNVRNENGDVTELEIPEAIHTFAAWKSLGRQVKKGEHAIAKFPVWKQGKARKVKDEGTGEEKEMAARMFMKMAFFFTIGQTEPIKLKEK